MGFDMKYYIQKDYLPNNTKRRSGLKISKVKFIVAHDTGNPNSTAQGNVTYYTNSANEMSASAHLFVDDKEIIECIPAFGNPEKAWHVMYNKPKDNQLFGDDSNDVAIGVELCYSTGNGKIDNEESYKKYVWLLAYLCYKYNLNPLKHITGHHILDPQRKTDPVNALSKMGKTFNDLLRDVNSELKECKGDGKIVAAFKKVVTKVTSKKASIKLTYTRILRNGDSGQDVKALQVALNSLGHDCDVDGVFGKGTEKSVKNFQKYKGEGSLSVDGIVGKNTINMINRLIK